MISNPNIPPLDLERSQKAKILKAFYLQEQWNVKIDSEIAIDPTPNFFTIFQAFKPKKFLWISSEKDLISIWNKEISSQKVLGLYKTFI